ncbi:hypothetical protein DFH09DRAFT_879392, partial [Mycena vulgaris]
ISSDIAFYYQALPKDRVFTKCLVYTVYVIWLVQTVLATHDTFSNFVNGFGDTSVLLNLYLLWFRLPIMSGL